MTTLTVTTRGQVTFRKDVLKHLGIQPGGKIRLDLLLAMAAVESASLVAISVHSLCEPAWVLGGKYAMSRKDIAAAIRGLAGAQNVVVNRPAVDAGLAVLDSGGDFADGVIAFDGQWLGGEAFVSFDRKAVEILEGQGVSARLLS